MTSQTTFPCIACGAPVEPEANRDYTSCTYCGTNVEIPKSLRRTVTPQMQQSKMATQEDAAAVDVPKLLRQARPVATGALNLLFIWSWIRRLVPACFILMIVFIVICIGAIGLLAALGGN